MQRQQEAEQRRKAEQEKLQKQRVRFVKILCKCSISPISNVSSVLLGRGRTAAPTCSEERTRRSRETSQGQVSLGHDSQSKFGTYDDDTLCLIRLEAEKAKAAASAAATAAAAASAAASAAAGPSKMLNTTVTLQSDLSYHITPVRVKKPVNKVYNPDNYDIDDMRSDDSTDDESKPKKVIPSWARSKSLTAVGL